MLVKIIGIYRINEKTKVTSFLHESTIYTIKGTNSRSALSWLVVGHAWVWWRYNLLRISRSEVWIVWRRVGHWRVSRVRVWLVLVGILVWSGSDWNVVVLDDDFGVSVVMVMVSSVIAVSASSAHSSNNKYKENNWDDVSSWVNVVRVGCVWAYAELDRTPNDLQV